MEKKELNSVFKENKFLKDGTKQACVKIRDFLFNSTHSDHQICSSKKSCVNVDEFIEAVETITAFAFQQDDTIPERWKCGYNCEMKSSLLCPGECNLSNKTNKICPFYIDEDA